ncbi:MAG: DUF2309 family protein [Verrucomicrobia bacterium]|jgi:uncharacterized protein YbcC (UPF0753/DUF2309 family)|nr:DUF2309 family protein [Verrucomicrobiota bacterium]
MNEHFQNQDEALMERVRLTCQKVAPLWPLSHFVAVNPFVGFVDQRFARVAESFQRIQKAQVVLPRDWFSAKYASGAIGHEDVRAAVDEASPEVVESFAAEGEALSVERLVALLNESGAVDEAFEQSCAFSAYMDSREGTQWQHIIREEVAKWCAAYDDEGQSSWKFPWKDLCLYNGWKEAASIDRNPELNGLVGFRQFVADLPDEPEAVVARAVETLQVPDNRIESLVYRILMTLPGWAGHLRYKDRERELRGESGSSLLQLLAILLSYDLALFDCHGKDKDRLLGWQRHLEEAITEDESQPISFELAQRIVWQAALEHAFAERLRHSVRPDPASTATGGRPEVQAVFCIDVRSEVFRRALESTGANIQTIGFAGFFGVPIDHKVPGLGGSQARCPALLAPPIRTSDCMAGLEASEFDQLTFQRVDARESKRTWKRFKEAASSCFTFVETIGLSYGVELVKDAFGLGGKQESEQGAPDLLDTLRLEARSDLAEGILRGLGLLHNFARVVLFCGHGCATRNNPYASGLDCGACGGHAGDANARLAAALLNQPDVRAELAGRNIPIPEDTVFIGGLHNTTTDAVRLFDDSRADPNVIGKLRDSLDQAGVLCATERAARLGHAAEQPDVVDAVRARSRDWSQVRPEWALAGNAAFIVAPRAWTAGADLEGRAFLHEYSADTDPEGAVLENILAGPLVVASWINLQYYASATDNAHFGSGHKSIHNVVGGVGVALGNEYDLRPGLPFQSVYDGEKLVHEPLRLHTCVAAEPEVIDAILGRQAHVRQLVENGWVHLFALGADGRLWSQRQSDGSWAHADHRAAV